ncbi:OPT oligopeptide transporter protein-domain-containing protein, partial [Fomitopsis serialis]|uniref:OPT oligopeptide transporter protein-domain-containing protein n=1 Tax=Fomitopsis serialis TaxID=139415 RepID=UPI002008CD69
MFACSLHIKLTMSPGSNAWSQLTPTSLYVFASADTQIALTPCSDRWLDRATVLFWSPYARTKSQPDPHWQIMNRDYKEVPWYWYLGLLVFAFFAGLIVVLKGQTTLPWWSYLIALLLGGASVRHPVLDSALARMGNGIATQQLMKMVAGAINPGRLHDVVATSIGLAGDLKIGQYLKIPPRAMFVTQVWGTILGKHRHTYGHGSIVDAQRDILLSPEGTNVWSGQTVQSLNSAASPALPAHRPTGIRTDSVILPIIYMYAAWMTSGTNSPITSAIITGLVSQLWLRRYHPGWYRKYNYILGASQDPRTLRSRAWCAGRRRAGDDLHPVVRRVRRVGHAAAGGRPSADVGFLKRYWVHVLRG